MATAEREQLLNVKAELVRIAESAGACAAAVQTLLDAGPVDPQPDPEPDTGTDLPPVDPEPLPENPFPEFLAPTMHDSILNFGKVPTLAPNSISGLLPRDPMPDDVLSVPTGMNWILDGSFECRTLAVAGKVTVLGGSLKVQHLLVYEGGEWDCDPTTDFTLTIRDHLFEAGDEAQHGNGIVCMGKFTMRGQPKTPHARVGIPPRAGNLALILSEEVSGWKAGDRLVLPDTRQFRWESASQTERLRVASVAPLNAVSVSLESALLHDHLGGKDADGVIDCFPVVANLTRSVKVVSESGSGVRGHVLFTGPAEVHLSNVEFRSLGRSTFDRSSPTNMGGRYPIHLHHLTKPFLVEDCVSWCGMEAHPFRWGWTTHDVHPDSVMRGCVGYNWTGAGAFVLQSSGVTFERNLMIEVRGAPGSLRGDEAGMMGREGSGFSVWSVDCRLIDNVVCGCSQYSYALWGGAGSGQGGKTLLEFRGNEAAACFHGVMIWGVGADMAQSWDVPESVLEGVKLWHVRNNGYWGYPCCNVTFRDWKIRGDIGATEFNHGTVGLHYGDYNTVNHKVVNCDVQGMVRGIQIPPKVGDQSDPRTAAGGRVLIDGGKWRNFVNVEAETPTSTGGGVGLVDRLTEIVNPDFGPGFPESRYPVLSQPDVSMRYMAGRTDWVKDELRVFNDGERGSYRVWPMAFDAAWNPLKPPPIGGETVPDDAERLPRITGWVTRLT